MKILKSLLIGISVTVGIYIIANLLLYLSRTSPNLCIGIVLVFFVLLFTWAFYQKS